MTRITLKQRLAQLNKTIGTPEMLGLGKRYDGDQK